MKNINSRGAHIARYLLIGFFIVTPPWVTRLPDSAFHKLIAIVRALGGLYAMSMLASLVLGRKLLHWFEGLLTRLLLVSKEADAR